MSIKMGQLEVKKILFNSHMAAAEGEFEFIIDCDSIYFDAVYDNEGNLEFVNQHFYSQHRSTDDMDAAVQEQELLNIAEEDYSAKAYLLTKEEQGNEWLRFHAVVPQNVDADYFYQKYIGE